MEFLVDECVARPIVQALRRRFADVVSVQESAPGLPDTGVLRWAQRERRVLVTDDYDFGDLSILSRRPAHAIVILGPGVFQYDDPGSADHIGERIAQLADTLFGRLTIIELRRTRQRDLP